MTASGSLNSCLSFVLELDAVFLLSRTAAIGEKTGLHTTNQSLTTSTAR
jgi:hypothetical protein